MFLLVYQDLSCTLGEVKIDGKGLCRHYCGVTGKAFQNSEHVGQKLENAWASFVVHTENLRNAWAKSTVR